MYKLEAASDLGVSVGEESWAIDDNGGRGGSWEVPQRRAGERGVRGVWGRKRERCGCVADLGRCDARSARDSIRILVSLIPHLCQSPYFLIL